MQLHFGLCREVIAQRSQAHIKFSEIIICSFYIRTYIKFIIDRLWGGVILNVKFVDRDYLILKEIDRWRVITGKHICYMCGFSGQRACDRRLNKLISVGIISRKKYIYGFPGIYSLTTSGRKLINVPDRAEQIRIEQITHDIAVLDTAIYFNKKFGIAFSDMITEKQLHKKDGFGVRRHRPDFVFSKDNNLFCVEVELNMKSKDRFLRNIISNFTDYYIQIWVVPDKDSNIAGFLSVMKKDYPNIKIIELDEVKNYEFK